MTFDEMVTQVISKTNRPDMTYLTGQAPAGAVNQDGGTGEIPAAIQAATVYCHSMGGEFFKKDLQNSNVTFLVPGLYQQTIDTTALTRFRKLSFIKKTDDPTLTYSGPLLPPLDYKVANRSKAIFDIAEPDDLFDPVWGLEKQDIAWEAGDTITLKSSTPLSTCFMSWYQFPDTAIATYTSWVARDYPWAVIYTAVSSIFSDTGQQDQSRKLDSPQGGLAYQHQQIVLKSSILSKGY